MNFDYYIVEWPHVQRSHLIFLILGVNLFSIQFILPNIFHIGLYLDHNN